MFQSAKLLVHADKHVNKLAFSSPLGALRTLEESLLSHQLDKKKEKKKKFILVAALKMQSSRFLQ